ncbi:hypothetical protein VTK26DRAFT_8114 [Humicola hyalothermophila]
MCMDLDKRQGITLSLLGMFTAHDLAGNMQVVEPPILQRVSFTTVGLLQIHPRNAPMYLQESGILAEFVTKRRMPTHWASWHRL